MPGVTQILSRIEAADPGVTKVLLPLVYEELRRLAARQLAEDLRAKLFKRVAPPFHI